MRDVVLAPGPHHDLEAFLGAVAALVERNVVARELVGIGPAAHSDIEPPAGEHVGHCDLPGQPQRMVEGQNEHAGAEPHASCLGCRLDGEHERLRARTVTHEMMLGEPHHLQPLLLGTGDLLEEIAVHGVEGAAGTRPLEQQEEPESHARPPDQVARNFFHCSSIGASVSIHHSGLRRSTFGMS